MFSPLLRTARTLLRQFHCDLVGSTHPLPSGGRPSLQVVDDQYDATESLAFLLQLHGFPVRTASDGAQALEAIASEVPDAVLLDLRMPAMDGWELARRIRAGWSPTASPSPVARSRRITVAPKRRVLIW